MAGVGLMERFLDRLPYVILISVLAGATFAAIMLASQGLAKAGDLLSFFGGAIGAGLAIVGAEYLAVRRRKAESIERHTALRFQLDRIKKHADDLKAKNSLDWSKLELREMENAHKILMEVRRVNPPTDMNLMAALVEFDENWDLVSTAIPGIIRSTEKMLEESMLDDDLAGRSQNSMIRDVLSDFSHFADRAVHACPR